MSFPRRPFHNKTRADNPRDISRGLYKGWSSTLDPVRVVPQRYSRLGVVVVAVVVLVVRVVFVRHPKIQFDLFVPE